MAYSVRPISQVCEELLKIHFGDVAASVGRYLLRRGNRSVGDIVSATGLSTNETQKALAVLIQNNLVKFQQSVSKQSIDFSAEIPNIYRLLRFPKYLYTMKRMFGDYEEMLVEVLLNQGQSSASNIIFMAANRLIEAHEDGGQPVEPSKLYEKFKKMASLQFFIRCPDLIASDTVGVPKFNHITDENDKLPFEVPDLDLVSLNLKLKEKATTLGEYSDSSIIWRINFDKFDEELRNVILINAAARRVDGTAGELYHILLDLWSEISCRNAPTTNSVTLHQIKTAVLKTHNSLLLKHLDEYLKVLVEDPSDLLTKFGDAGGGQYVLNVKSVFEKLACATLDSIVLERFGSKALRLFRVARAENFIEQDPLHTLSMIVPKDVKMLSYNLLEQNFMQMQDLKKGGSSGGAPVKSFNLFYVDLPQVARTALELCYKGLFNTLVRKEHMTTTTENQRVLEKHNRMESVLHSIQDTATEQDLALVQDFLTPTEKSLIHRIKSTIDLLTLGELKVDESIFILESYLRFVEE